MEVTLHQGDCLDRMKEIADGSVDMILADLPYGTVDAKWDVRIPMKPLWEQYKRVIKQTGAIVLFGSEPFSSMLRTSGAAMYKYDWIWKKNRATGFQHAKNMPLKAHEVISVFSKAPMGHASLLGEKRMVYNPQGIIKVDKISKNTKNKFGNVVGRRPSHKERFLTEYRNYPTSVLEYPLERGFQSAQKPVPLLEYLIRTYTSPGETVLDNVMGSGSCGVAAVNTGRNFIGIELDQEYFQIAQRRIQAARDEIWNV